MLPVNLLLKANDGDPLIVTGRENRTWMTISSPPIEYCPGIAEIIIINGVRLSILMLEFVPSEPKVPGRANSKLASMDGLVLACLIDPECTPSKPRWRE